VRGARATARSPASARASSSDSIFPADEAHCGTADRIGGQLPYEQQNVSGSLARVTDSEIGPEGGAWDFPVAVTIRGSGSITYDFSQPETLRALYLQADANDTYRVSGSADGKVFRSITEFPSAFSRGHGLRSRAIQIEPTQHFIASTG
jgi:hypothetical protein